MKGILFLFLIPVWLWAAYGVSSDEEYLTQEFDFATIVYPKSMQEVAERAAGKLEAALKAHDKDYGAKLRNKPVFALFSPQNQIANAFATAFPYLETSFFSGGSLMLDYFGYVDWIDMLVAHEGSHLYQLDAASELPAAVENVLGRNYFLFVPFTPIPFFTKPNLFLPTMMLEGNAVYRESLLTKQGRLYGGRHRALFLSLLKAGKLNAKRLINDHQSFPYGEEKYIVGGFFWAWLDKRFGGDGIDRFFSRAGGHYINPLRLNTAFKESFGVGFYALLAEFLNDYASDAAAFVEQDGELISLSKVYAPLGGSRNELLIYEGDAKTYGSIIKIDRKSGKKTLIDGDFFGGRPFCGGFGCGTIADARISADRYAIGMFDKNRKPIDGFNGKVVQDVLGDRVLFFDAAKSYEKAALYDANRSLGYTVSGARYGANGEVYYARFENDRRVFYRDETPLFEVESEAFLADVLPNGKLLFTAPTRFGSALFMWDRGKIVRLGNADNVLDARHIADDRFLVVSVTANGYETRRVSLAPRGEAPFRTRFAFENRQTPSMDASHKKLKGETYNEFSMLRFASIAPTIYADNDGFKGTLSASLTDPLDYNSLELGYAHTNSEYATIDYKNDRRRLFFGAQGYGRLDLADQGERDWGAAISAGYLLSQDANSRADITLWQYFDPDDRYSSPQILSLAYNYAMRYQFGHRAERGFNVALHSRVNDRDGAQERANSASASGVVRLFGDVYFELGGKFSQADSGWISLSDSATELLDDPLDFHLGNIPYSYRANRIVGGKAVLSAAIDTPLYFESVPLSLHRVIPKISYERLELGKKERNAIEESAFAAEMELLVAHRISILVEGGVIHNPEAKEDKFYFVLKTEL
ncbi:MAG: hypothetical protein LBQ52_02345 [Helicobacteraceae bacterium]|nr:hypothetical protein [Helicobacteraceae bacterium]